MIAPKIESHEVPESVRRRRERVSATSAIVAAAVAAAIVAGFVLIKAVAILLTAFGAIVIGEAARPIVDRLSARVPRPLAVLIAFTALVAVTGAAWWLLFRELAPQFAAFLQAMPGYLSAIARLLTQIAARSPISIGGAPPAPVGPLMQALFGAGITVATFASTIVLALVLAIFWLGSSDALRGFVVSLVAPKSQRDADALFRELGAQLGGYANATFINGAIVAAASIVVLLLLRTPFPLVLGLVQGLLIALPYVGTFIGVLVVGAVVLPAQGWLHALIAILLIALVATLEANFVAPLVFKKSLHVDPFFTTLAIALGATLFGSGGMLLAVPAAAVMQTLAVRVVAPAIRRAHGVQE